ncbi:MAG: RDD family protein [Desulfuromonadaceae bacterium]|nr:RDD family protein [Desulfuromonadaceae bacterium]
MLLRRALASLLDLLLVCALWYAEIRLADGLLGRSTDLLALAVDDSALRMALYLLFVTSALGYSVVFHYMTGQTPGKLCFGLRLVSCSETVLSLAQVLIRVGGSLLSCLSGGFGFWVARNHDRQQGWHDRLAETCVVDEVTLSDPLCRSVKGSV